MERSGAEKLRQVAAVLGELAADRGWTVAEARHESRSEFCVHGMAGGRRWVAAFAAARDEYRARGRTTKAAVSALLKTHNDLGHLLVLRQANETAAADVRAWARALEPSVEFWTVPELLANPTRCAMVPLQELDSANECPVPPESLPRMFPSDPIARWHAWKTGDVVRVTRVDTLTGGPRPGDPLSYYWRVVGWPPRQAAAVPMYATKTS